MNHLDYIELFLYKCKTLQLTVIALNEKYDIHVRDISKSIDSNINMDLFPIDIRKEAEIMKEFYVKYYCMENYFRQMILAILSDKFHDKWQTQLPPDILKFAEEKKEDDKNLGMDISDNILSYTEFGQLLHIIKMHADLFEDIIPITGTNRIISGFIKSRNFVAHCRFLSKDEQQRIDVLIKDLLRII